MCVFKLNPPRNRSSPFIKINILGLDFVMRFVLKVIKPLMRQLWFLHSLFYSTWRKGKSLSEATYAESKAASLKNKLALGHGRGEGEFRSSLFYWSHLHFISSFWYLSSGALDSVILAFIAGVSEKCQHAPLRQCSFKQNLDGILPTILYVIFNITIAKTP